MRRQLADHCAMTTDLATALITFAFVSSITPGPNNLMLLASGANYGVRRTVPHMLGISLGHALMVFLVGVGLIQVFDAFPVTHTVLTVASVAYMLFLAWKIATAVPALDAPAAPDGSDGDARGTGIGDDAASADRAATGQPFTFLQAAAFQWVNPKAWAMALTAITVYAPERDVAAVLLVAGIFAAVNLPSVSAWAALGQQMQRILTNRRRLMAFNWTMAALLVGSLWWMVG